MSLMEETIRNSTRLNEKDSEWSLGIFKAIMLLVSVQPFMYVGASLANRHNVPRMLNAWKLLEYKLSSHQNPVTWPLPVPYKTAGHKALVLAIAGISIMTGLLSASFIPEHPDFWLEAMLTFIVWTYMVMMQSYHDLIAVLLLKELRNNYTQVSPR